MKDSGIDWIGAIPVEWDLLPFRHVLHERTEKNVPIKSTERLSLSLDLGVTLYAEKTTNLDRFKDDFEQYKIAHEGDLVMNSMNMIVGATGVSDYYGCVSPAYYTFYDDTLDHVTAKYCEYIFRSKTMLRVLYSLGKGIYAIVRGDDRVNTCRLKVSREDLRSIVLPMPGIDEQREIIKYLTEKTRGIDNLVAQKQQIALNDDGNLHHYRLDRMTAIEILDEKRGISPKSPWLTMNWKEYVNSSFGMGLTYPTEYLIGHDVITPTTNLLITVTLQFTRDLVGVVMDRFGRDVILTPTDKGHFVATFQAYQNAQFMSWLVSLGKKVQVISPTEFRKDLSRYARRTGCWHHYSESVADSEYSVWLKRTPYWSKEDEDKS